MKKNLNSKFKIQSYFYPKRLLSFLFILFLFAVSVYAGRRERLIETWQPVHFGIDLTFNFSLTEISSAKTEVTVLIRKADVTMIDFDFGAMNISTVTVDGEPAKFAQHNDKLDVYLTTPAKQNQKLKVVVSYSGTPKDGLIMTKDRDGFPSAVGDNWADRVHNWIPCFDHPSAKATVKFTVTAHSNYVVVANGKIESATASNSDLKTWVFNETSPVSPYNMVVAVGNFANAEIQTKSLFPFRYYVPQSDRPFAEQGFSPAVPSVLLFNKLVAPYPYEKLALIVGATRFGGMENANTIVFSPNLFRDFETARPRSQRYNIPSAVEEVVAHEIAHQWFGDSVTQTTWADLWLSEGFATYFAGLFLENYESKDAFRAYMKRAAETYLRFSKQRRIPIHDKETENLFRLLNANNYQKGAWVLHTLRGHVGDKAFFDGLKIYYNRHKSSTATTEDLRSAFEKSSGKKLKDFFDRWIYKAGHPVYQISWSVINNKTIEIKLNQIQEDEPFLIPVTIELATNKGTRRVSIIPTGKETKLKIKSGKPKKITIDPDEIILKEIAS